MKSRTSLREETYLRQMSRVSTEATLYYINIVSTVTQSALWPVVDRRPKQDLTESATRQLYS